VVHFFTHLLSPQPQPVLAAIVLFAVAGLFQASALRNLSRSSMSEFLVAVAAFLGVLGSGLLRGVLIGAIISLVELLRRASRPHVALLGRIPGTRRFSDWERHEGNELIPGLQIYRPEANLVYFNIEQVCDTIRNRVRADPPKEVIVDLSASPQVDLQSAHTLAALARELVESGVRFQAVETRSSVRELFRQEQIDAQLGGVDRFTSVADAVDAFQKSI
jgi:MFS superfamily sulfate permease-like transporter